MDSLDARPGRLRLPRPDDRPPGPPGRLRVEATGTGLRVTAPGGQQVVVDDNGRLELSTGGTRIVVEVSGAVSLQTVAAVDVAAGSVTVISPVTRFSGLVECDTLVARSGVVSPSYTPGAGNLS